jgi:hypothetical protein
MAAMVDGNTEARSRIAPIGAPVARVLKSGRPGENGGLLARRRGARSAPLARSLGEYAQHWAQRQDIPAKAN